MPENAETFTRARLLAYRSAAHDLDEPRRPATECAVLKAGIRDNPAGGTAHLALRARSTGDLSGLMPDVGSTDTLTLAYTIRAALHVHLNADLDKLAAALTWDTVNEPAPATFGPVETGSLSLESAYQAVVSAITDVMADGTPRTKGELSGAVTTALEATDLDPAIVPWCPGCSARHVHDGMFRAATLTAGLRAVTHPAEPFQLHPAAHQPTAYDGTTARAELVRSFLALSGAAGPAQLGKWLGLTAASAKAWWATAGDEVVRIRVETAPGAFWSGWAHRDNLDALRTAEPASGVHALPPYDPFTELADRDLLMPDRARRKLIWRAARNPGVVLVDGEIHGLWSDRRHRSGGRSVTVRPFRQLTGARRKAARERLEKLFSATDTLREIAFEAPFTDAN